MIIKINDNKWRVVSHTGKNLGEEDSYEKAKKRLAQVEMFKHMDKDKVNKDQEGRYIMKEEEKEKLKNILEKIHGANNLSEKDFLAESERIKAKMNKGLLYSTLNEQDFYNIRDSILEKNIVKPIYSDDIEQLDESILDPLRKERAKFIFDSNDKMLPEVKKWILDKIEAWKKTIKLDFDISGIQIYGSSTGFQYTDNSDIDTHCRVTLSIDQIAKVTGKLISLGTLLENNVNPVSLYLFSTDEPAETDFTRYENIYDIEKDEWVKKTDKGKYIVPYNYIMELSEFFMDALDLTLSKFDRAKHEYLKYKALDPNIEEITEKEKNDAVEKAFTEFKAAHDRVRMAQKVAIGFGKAGYDESTEFTIHINYNTGKDPRFSVNNSIYKMLEKFGYKDALQKLIDDGNAIIKADEKEKNDKIEEDKNKITESFITSLKDRYDIRKNMHKNGIYVKRGINGYTETSKNDADYILYKNWLFDTETNERIKKINAKIINYKIPPVIQNKLKDATRIDILDKKDMNGEN